MGSSKRKSRQLSEQAEEPFYSIRGILKENKTQYLVDWEDIDDQKFEPTWEPKQNVTEAAIQEWEEKKTQKASDEERKRKRKSTDRPSSSHEVIEIEDDDEQRPAKRTMTPGSKGPMLYLGKRRSNAAVEVTPPSAKLPKVAKRKPGRPRKEVPDIQSRKDGDEEMPSKPPPRPRGRPRKSLPGPDVVRKAREQDENGEDTDQQSARLGRSSRSSPLQKKTSHASEQRRKRPKVVNVDLSDDDDDDVPLKRLVNRKRPLITDFSDDEVQHVGERAQPTSAKKRGRPRKVPRQDNTPSKPTTPAAASRPEEVSMAEIEDSEMYDAAAAQLQRETRSARKQSPSRQPSSPGREQSPVFNEEFSDFRSSQIISGTQPEPPRPEKSIISPEELTDSQHLVDAAAASSLSAKNSPYEPGATSGSTFVNSTVNSSSSVHTLLIPLARRFGADAVIPDSQSHLDASSVHISEQIAGEQQMDDQMETFEDASTESQVVVEQADATQQVTNHEQPVPESSMVQKPEDAPQPDVAAPATQSEPSLELSTRNKIVEEAASSLIAQGIAEHVSTRSPSPVSLGAVRSSSTSSAPPTEAADKSTQSQSQLQSETHQQLSATSQAQDEVQSEAPSSPSAPNQESGQNTLSLQTQPTNQQSHVEQAAQQTSFQLHQPPTQQIPPFEFAQSSVEEVATSSLGFNTQIQPAHQAPAHQPPIQHESAEGVSIPSSPIASPPSNLPNTIGASAPSPIKSTSDPELSGVHTPTSDMSPTHHPDGTPMTVVEKLKASKAKVAADFEAQKRAEAERVAREKAALAASTAGAAPAPSTPTPSRVAAPVLDVRSPKPASAVPARLMSPAVGDREARSPSTVPPVEIIPEETPEEYSRSERYETLLPGQGPQINAGTSRPYLSQDLTMNDASVDTESDNNQHLVSLDFGVSQKDHYKCAFETCKNMIEDFTLHKVWPANSDLAQQARDFVVQLHYIVNHLDLNNPGTSSASQTSQSLQAEWDMTMSSKFRFLKSLLDAAKSQNLHIALLVEPGRLAAILQNFLQGISIMYNVIDGQNNVINHESTATILLTSVGTIETPSSLDIDMVVVLDGSMSSDTITRTQKMLSQDALVPTISLVIPLSIEHVERCLPSNLSEAERLHVLISTVTNERLAAGWQSRGADTEFESKASDIISWVLNPAEADWPFYGLPNLQLVEALSSQSGSEDELMVNNNGMSNKRQLDNDEAPLAKRVRVDKSLPLTINPADMHITPGTLPMSNSHVSDSVAASQHAATLQELHQAQAQLRELTKSMETLQYNHEEQRAEMVKAQKERNDALQREERLITSNNDLRAKNTLLRDEVLDLKKQLETARVALVNHTVPEIAEIEKIKAEALAATVERDREAKRAQMAETQLGYVTSQYQTASTENTKLAAANDQLTASVAELEVKASGEQARLKELNNNALNNKYSGEIKKLRHDLSEREGTMQRMSEELNRLREPRGRVGTRASSIPRSPRAGTREPQSRQGSPSVQRPHPLSKMN
ncbi:hypothetical protein KCU81_g8909, partial [Aureobasidium melanogenum]|uniref:Chromo domain-containing protein n=1 Tax=Aureobasidium melanogenum (strain CBS 110374) TaxID=1043003 RepID=A0A074VL27_AURM1